MKKLTVEEQANVVEADEAERNVYSEQQKEITRKYGKEAAENANYGWAVDEDGVATKVYNTPDGVMILCTGFDEPHVHSWLEY